MTPSIDITPPFNLVPNSTLFPNLTFYQIARGFHKTFSMGVAWQQSMLISPDTWCVLMLKPISPVSFEHPSVVLFHLHFNEFTFDSTTNMHTNTQHRNRTHHFTFVNYMAHLMTEKHHFTFVNYMAHLMTEKQQTDVMR